MTWQAPTPGQATLAGHVNQLLVGHSSTPVYAGALSTSFPSYSGSADPLGAGMLATSFTVATATTMTYAALWLGAIGAGADVIVSLQTGTTTPNGTMLAAAIVPAEWLVSGLESLQPGWIVPLSYSLAASTTYFLVVQPACGVLEGSASAFSLTQAFAGTDDVQWSKDTVATSGALVWSSGSWTAKGYAYDKAIFAGTGGTVVGMADDHQTVNVMPPSGVAVSASLPTKQSAYGYSTTLLTEIVSAYAFTARSPTTPQNLLCRQDASFEAGVGTMTATNATLANTGQFALDGFKSLKVTASGTPTSTSATTGKYPVTASATYTAAAYVTPESGKPACNVTVGISWYTSASVLISTSTSTAASTGAAGVWTQFAETATAPSNAALATITVTLSAISGNLSGDVYDIDEVNLTPGTSPTWAYPGVGVASARTLSWTSGIMTGVT